MPILEGLILDFGEVLVEPQPAASVVRLAAVADMPLDEFTQGYWRQRLAYDAGLSARDYWTSVVGVDRATPQRIADLIEADAASWLHYREEMWQLAAAFKRAGGRTAMLSNGVPEIVARLRTARPLEPYFDVVVVSCEVGCTKPDPEIYRICLDRLGLPGPSALFVDDRIENIEAAARLGIQTLHFRGEQSIAALIERLALNGNAR
jgi:putative hydrolase of the HAD superfamily